MFNSPGIKTVKAVNTTQILLNPQLFHAVGCIVPQTLGVSEGGSKIAKAGTPLKIDFNNLKTDAVKADGDTNAMNAILLHDVDVTNGKNNGTAVIFGFINFNRVDTTTQSDLTTALGNASASKLITVIKA